MEEQTSSDSQENVENRIMRADLPCQNLTYYKATIIKTCIAVLQGRSVEQKALRQTPVYIIIEHIIKVAFEISGEGMEYSIKDAGTMGYLFKKKMAN